MEVDSKVHPFLSYILSLRPLRQPLMLASKPSSSNAIGVDLEANEQHGEALVREMPKLLQLELVAKITGVVSNGPLEIGRITRLWKKPVAALQRPSAIFLGDWKKSSWRSQGCDRGEWLSLQAQKEKDALKVADKEKLPFKAVVHLYEMHIAYEDLLHEAEERLKNIYREAENGSQMVQSDDGKDDGGDDMDEEVVRILIEATKKKARPSGVEEKGAQCLS